MHLNTVVSDCACCHFDYFDYERKFTFTGLFLQLSTTQQVCCYIGCHGNPAAETDAGQGRGADGFSLYA